MALSERPHPEKRVVAMVADDDIFTVPYSDHFEALEDFTDQSVIQMQHRKHWEYAPTSHDIYWHQARYRESLEKFRAEQDAKLDDLEALAADYEAAKAQFKKGDKVMALIGKHWSQEYLFGWSPSTFSVILSPKPPGEPSGTATIPAGQIRASPQTIEPLEPTPANLFRAHEDTHTLAKKEDWKAQLDNPNAFRGRSILDFQIGEQVFDKRYPAQLGTVEKILDSGKIRVVWDVGGSSAQTAKYLQKATPNDFDSWLGDDKGNDDNFDFTTMEGFGVLATAH